MLDANAIIAEAEAATGISDPDTHLHVNLHSLIAALNSGPALSEAGLASTRRSELGRSIDRLEGLKWLRDHPDIAEQRITAPVFLTGLPRSGTTYFQYLFDRDRRFRLIRSWESIMPNPPPGVDTASVMHRKSIEAQRRRQSKPMEIEGFEAMHLMDDDGPDECHVYLTQAYAAAGYFNVHDVPEFFDFLMDGLDLAAAYRVHKRQLQLLQWQMPHPRWALKYPNHVIAMDPILEVYPDARFVMTHRDPVQVLASICKMSFALRSTRYAAAVDPQRVGRQMLGFVRRHVDRIMAFCNGPNAGLVTHVNYYRLVEDPAVLMREIHAGIGIDTPGDVRDAIASWRRDNPKGARGKNDYTLEQFGIDPAEARALYHDYSQFFDIPQEDSR